MRSRADFGGGGALLDRDGDVADGAGNRVPMPLPWPAPLPIPRFDLVPVSRYPTAFLNARQPGAEDVEATLDQDDFSVRARRRCRPSRRGGGNEIVVTRGESSPQRHDVGTRSTPPFLRAVDQRRSSFHPAAVIAPGSSVRWCCSTTPTTTSCPRSLGRGGSARGDSAALAREADAVSTAPSQRPSPRRKRRCAPSRPL